MQPNMNKIQMILLFCAFLVAVNAENCWTSGCQPNDWEKQGCYPEDKWQQSGESWSCPGGKMFRCCEKQNSGGGGGNPGNGALASRDEFRQAVTSNGFREPRDDQYNAMTSQAKSAGGIASKQEQGMLLAQLLQESGGLVYTKEIACAQTGCPGQYDNSVGYPGKNYYGRGYMQLSHSYNYKAASYDLYGDDRLLRNPDLVSDNEQVNWATTFWYWKTRVRNQPNVLNFWFGSATNAINGGIECRGGRQDLARQRFEYYKKVLIAFHINATPIPNGCYN